LEAKAAPKNQLLEEAWLRKIAVEESKRKAEIGERGERKEI
jgi:hypothetical protein